MGPDALALSSLPLSSASPLSSAIRRGKGLDDDVAMDVSHSTDWTDGLNMLLARCYETEGSCIC